MSLNLLIGLGLWQVSVKEKIKHVHTYFNKPRNIIFLSIFHDTKIYQLSVL